MNWKYRLVLFVSSLSGFLLAILAVFYFYYARQGHVMGEPNKGIATWELVCALIFAAWFAGVMFYCLWRMVRE